MKRFMRTILPDIEPLQQPLQLAALEAEHPGLTLGPGKPVPLQPLLPETKTVAVPVEDLDHIPAPVAEGKQMPGERVQLQVHLNQEAKTVDGLSHVGVPHREKDTQMLRDHHLSPRRAATTCWRVG